MLWSEVQVNSLGQQLAPFHSTYGYDVIVQIGWERQYGYEDFLTIWQELSEKVQISESQVRHLYYERSMYMTKLL